MALLVGCQSREQVSHVDLVSGDGSDGDTGAHGDDDAERDDAVGGDSCLAGDACTTPVALRFDAGLLTGNASYGGREFLPLMPHVANASGSCDSSNAFCGGADDAIANTEYDGLYRGQIWSCGDSLNITVAVPNGIYDLYLHNTETTPAQAEVGGRLASVEVEGAIVLNSWDIYADAGESMHVAIRRAFTVEVTDGQLDLRLIAVASCPKICAVEILSAGLLPLPLGSEVTCDDDGTCGTDYAGAPYCMDGDVYSDWHDFSCVAYQCQEATTPQLQTDCGTHSCVSGQCLSSNLGDFNIVFAQNFNDNPTGAYLRTTWSSDWGISASAWSDPCYSNCADEENWAEARLTIHEENGNRFMRHELFTKGTSPGTSGTGWWKNIGAHEELYLSFRIRFSGEHWTQHTYDGKLPGFCGSAGCPGGGNPPTNYEGFSTRYMFKGVEGLFFYLYFAGMDLSDGNWGDSLYFSPYDVNAGEWHTVSQRVVMNDPGSANGIVEGFLDGTLVASRYDMDYRNAAGDTISQLYFANFLGGSGEEPSDFGETPDLDFDDFVVFTYADHLTGVPRGVSGRSSTTTPLYLPQP